MMASWWALRKACPLLSARVGPSPGLHLNEQVVAILLIRMHTEIPAHVFDELCLPITCFLVLRHSRCIDCMYKVILYVYYNGMAIGNQAL